jgi:IPT/TIG domain
MKLYNVFPGRGPSTGGSVISIFGINIKKTPAVTVTAGGIPCTNTKIISTRQIDCTLSGGEPGLLDIIITQGMVKSELKQAYRYILGMPSS